MIVLVTGGRDYPARDRLRHVLTEIHTNRAQISAIVEGNAGAWDPKKKQVKAGADKLAGEWALDNGIPNIKFPPPFRKYQKKAGPIRNGWMISGLIKIDVVIAFPGGKGTQDMVEKAEEQGIRVVKIDWMKPKE